VIFDLQGKKKRRAIQATYLVLALLLGSGLVLFGIGSDAPGGILGSGHGGDGGHGGDADFGDQIERIESEIAADPDNPNLLGRLVRVRFQAATAAAETSGGHGGTTTLTDESLAHLDEATGSWEQYVDRVRRPAPEVAQVATQAYLALGDAAGVAEGQTVIAREAPSVGNYRALATYRYLANDEAGGDQAGERALELAEGAERSQVRAQLEAAKQQAAAAGAAPAGAGGGHG